MIQLFLINAHGEYRVYKLGVKYDEKQKAETEVLTTLDDLQYVTYFKITPTQSTRIIDHWMCYGRTDEFRAYCPAPIKPRRPNPDQANAQPNLGSKQESPPQPSVPVMVQ